MSAEIPREISSALQNDRPVFEKTGHDFFVYTVTCKQRFLRRRRSGSPDIKRPSNLVVAPPPTGLPLYMRENKIGARVGDGTLFILKIAARWRGSWELVVDCGASENLRGHRSRESWGGDRQPEA